MNRPLSIADETGTGAAKQSNRRGIGVVDGIGKENLISRLKEAAQSQG